MPQPKPDLRAAARLLVVAMVLAGTMVYLRAASRPEVLPVRPDLEEFPLQVGEWTGISAPEFDNEVLEILGVDDYITRVYETPAAATTGGPRHQLGLYVGYYKSQRQGDTIHSPMNCLPGAGWLPVQMGTQTLPSRDDQPAATVNRVLIQKGEDRQLVLYWYQGRGRVVANEYMSKALLVWDAGTRNRSDGALVRVISPVLRSETDTGQAAERAVEFGADLHTLLARFLPS